MSKEERKVSLQDIQSVQDLIETCLKLYMSQSEVESRLLYHAKIEPRLTQQVWKCLEAQNQEFFRVYHLRLMVKDQILQFNQLLEKQVELARDINQMGPASFPMSNGTIIHSMHNSAYRAELSGPYMKTHDMHRGSGAIPSIYGNGLQSVQPSMLVNMMGHSGRFDVPPNMLMDRSTSVGMMQGLNGGMIKADGGFGCNSPMMHAAAAAAAAAADNSLLLQPRNGIGGMSTSPINGSESTGRSLHESMLNPVTNSFGFLGQMAQNFSLADMTADFSNTADMLESYLRSPFQGMDASLLDPPIREEQQDTGWLDATSEELSYKDFGSE